MERLSKNQKKILTYVYKRFREEKDAEYVTLVNYLGDNPLDTSADIELLMGKGLIKYPDAISYQYISITPEGIEKLRESFITRLQDSAYNNPWAVVAIFLSLVLGLITLWK